MDCDIEIHNDLINMEKFMCPFCDQHLVEIKSTPTQCCSNQDIQSIEGIMVCIQCGSVQDSEIVSEPVDFYQDMYKLRRKSVYMRKYRIENVLNDICFKHGIALTHDQRKRIYKIFDLIDTILPLVNGDRKRLISSKFLVKRIFMLFSLPFEFIKDPKSEKTLQFYNRYWAKILLLKSYEINHIIMR